MAGDQGVGLNDLDNYRSNFLMVTNPHFVGWVFGEITACAVHRSPQRIPI
jgi:hypothetical protein